MSNTIATARRRIVGSLIGLALGIGTPFVIAPHADAAKPREMARYTPHADAAKPREMVRYYATCKTPAKAPRAKVGSACKYRATDPHTGRGRYAVVTYTRRGTHLVKWLSSGEVDREIRWVNGRARDLI